MVLCRLETRGRRVVAENLSRDAWVLFAVVYLLLSFIHSAIVGALGGGICERCQRQRDNGPSPLLNRNMGLNRIVPDAPTRREGARTIMDDLSLRMAKTLPVRAFLIAIPPLLLSQPVLWLTGFPLEHWTFVSCTFALCFVCSGLAVGRLQWLLVKRLDGYAHSAITRSGLEPLDPEQLDPGTRRVGTAVGMFVILSGSAASWGLALSAFVLAMQRMALPLPLSYLPTIAFPALAVGVVFSVLILGGLALALHLGERILRDNRRSPGWLTWGTYVIVRIGKSRSHKSHYIAEAA